MVLRSWCEISENGDRGSTQNFVALLASIVVWPREQFLGKSLRMRNTCFFPNGYVPKLQNLMFFLKKKLAGRSRQELLRMHMGSFFRI